MSTSSKQMALGGMLAALAVVIMALGGLIPVATYICPLLGMMLLKIVLSYCGKRIGWAWYGAVAILGLMLGPDKEAAAVFAALGYYPILIERLVSRKGKWALKFGWFKAVILLLYWLLIHLFGMDQISEEFQSLGKVMTVLMLVMGNVIFVLTDRLLGMKPGRSRHGRSA